MIGKNTEKEMHLANLRSRERKSFALPENEQLAQENWWLEDKTTFPFGKVYFQGRTVTFRVPDRHKKFPEEKNENKKTDENPAPTIEHPKVHYSYCSEGGKRTI